MVPTKEPVDSGATRAVRPANDGRCSPFLLAPSDGRHIPIRLPAAIAAMPVHEISVQRVRPALFPMGVATMNLQNEGTLSSPACPWNVRSGVGILAAHQTDHNKTNGGNNNHTSQGHEKNSLPVVARRSLSAVKRLGAGPSQPSRA